MASTTKIENIQFLDKVGVKHLWDNIISCIVGKKTTKKGEIFNDYENNTASGAMSHAEGQGTQTLNDAEHAEGKFNNSHVNTISSVGIGISNNDRENAIEIMNNGEVYIKGIGNYNGNENTLDNIKSLQYMIELIGSDLDGGDAKADNDILVDGGNAFG